MVPFCTYAPFYSTFHSVAAVLCLVPIYVMAALEIFDRKTWSTDKLLLVALCFFQKMLAGATYTDWNGRFLLVILPLFLFCLLDFFKNPRVTMGTVIV